MARRVYASCRRGCCPGTQRGGSTIAKVGDRIASGGGYSSSGYGDCPGGRFGIHSIKVLPDVEVYFPKQDGTLGTDQEMERFVGKLVVERRCLKVDDAVRVKDRVIMPGGRYLLIWPDTFALDLDDEVAGIVDAAGQVVARVGDEVQFSAVSISYQEAMDHSGSGRYRRPARVAIGWWERTLPLCRIPSLNDWRDSCR